MRRDSRDSLWERGIWVEGCSFNVRTEIPHLTRKVKIDKIFLNQLRSHSSPSDPRNILISWCLHNINTNTENIRANYRGSHSVLKETVLFILYWLHEYTLIITLQNLHTHNNLAMSYTHNNLPTSYTLIITMQHHAHSYQPWNIIHIHNNLATSYTLIITFQHHTHSL
jgi:hypothetical protein